MRLLVFTENYARGGGNRYLIDLVNGMAVEFDSIILASNPHGFFTEDTSRLDVPAQIVSVPVLTAARLRARGGWAARFGRVVSVLDPVVMCFNIVSLRRLVRRYDPDVLLVCNGGFPAARSTLAAAIAGRRAGIPVGLAVVGMPVARRRVLRRYEEYIDRAVWSAVDQVVVSGSAILGRLEALRSLPEGRGRVLANALPDLDVRHQSSGDRMVVGCVTRVARSKGMVELAAAFVEVARADGRVRLRIVGEGDASGDVRRITSEAGLSDRVELPGFVSGDVAVAQEVSGLDVYVLPTYGETHPSGEEGGGPPYSVLEAMRAGTAILTTSVGSIADGIEDDVEGVLVAPQSVSALAAALEVLVRDGVLRRRLGEAARQRFVREFTLPRMHARAAGFARDLIAFRR